MINAAYGGRMTWQEALAGVRAIREAAAMHLAEHSLYRQGVDDTAHMHRLGPTGGAPIVSAPNTSVAVEKFRRRGIDKHGNAIEEIIDRQQTVMPEVAEIAEQLKERAEHFLKNPPDDDKDGLPKVSTQRQFDAELARTIPPPPVLTDAEVIELTEKMGEI